MAEPDHSMKYDISRQFIMGLTDGDAENAAYVAIAVAVGCWARHSTGRTVGDAGDDLLRIVHDCWTKTIGRASSLGSKQ